MKRLIKFDFTRLRNKRILYLIPAIFLVIGISGVVLSGVFYDHVNPNIKLLNILNAYNQFTYIFCSAIYIFVFCNDIKHGINVYVMQMGYSMKEILFSKTFLLYVLSVFCSNSIFVFLFIILKSKSLGLLLTMLFDLDINLLFITLFCLFLSLIFKNTMTATIINFASFILFNTLNMLGFGLFNQADPNSISYTAIQASIGEKITHRTLSLLSLNIVNYKYILILMPNLVWILLLLLGIRMLSKKGEKTIEL